MQLFKLEYSKYTYYADFVFYAIVLFVIGCLLATTTKSGQYLEAGAYATIGLLGWTLMEYLIHRFVLHGLPPFKSWHAEHHRRPKALIFAPTFVSASLITLSIFIPAWLVISIWSATALTFGVLVGYLFYTLVHHTTHHWHTHNAWLKERKRWHALHHHSHKQMLQQPSHFGVTNGFWDKVFSSNKSTNVLPLK